MIVLEKKYFYIFGITLIKYGVAAIYCLIDNADFGKSFIGHDEFVWQDASVFFFEEGVSWESITLSMGLFQSFNVVGWPLLIGIFHIILGKSYYNVLILKAILFFFAASSLYSLLARMNYSRTLIYVAVVFLAIYYPLAACDRTYMRDDILVYLIIIMLNLSFDMKSIKIIYALPLFIICSYVLVFSRPLAFLVYIVLNLFYFKINKPINFVIVVVPLLLLSSLVFDVIGYGIAFLSTFKPNPLSLIFNTFKFFIGPLPWNMFYIDSEYEPYWYIVTFTLVCLTFLLKDFYIALAKNWQTLTGLYIVGFIPYAIGHQEVDLIGPRQFAMIGFFLFIILYHQIFIKIITHYVARNKK